MCSQPPIDRDDAHALTERNLKLIDLMTPAPDYLCITGGEPTLLEERLLTIVAKLRDTMPSTYVHMLTNGRRFAWADFASRFAAVRHPNLSLGIPLYADHAAVARLHRSSARRLRPNDFGSASTRQTWCRNRNPRRTARIDNTSTDPPGGVHLQKSYFCRSCRLYGNGTHRLRPPEYERTVDRSSGLSRSTGKQRGHPCQIWHRRPDLQSPIVSLKTISVEVFETVHFRLEKHLRGSVSRLCSQRSVWRLFPMEHESAESWHSHDCAIRYLRIDITAFINPQRCCRCCILRPIDTIDSIVVTGIQSRFVYTIDKIESRPISLLVSR